ncbi:hypothetical protein KAT51_00820 [bacterium]|nr:hypothetical protein [bacterium]
MPISREELRKLRPPTVEEVEKSIKEEEKEYIKGWHKKRPEYGKQHAKQWNKKHPEYIKEWRKNHPENVKQWRKNNPDTRKKSDAKTHAKRRRNLGFNPTNELFEGGVWHHINKNDVVCIPEKIHRSVRHNVFTGEGMEEINDLTQEFLLAELGEC